jgi:hypothetical protein
MPAVPVEQTNQPLPDISYNTVEVNLMTGVSTDNNVVGLFGASGEAISDDILTIETPVFASAFYLDASRGLIHYTEPADTEDYKAVSAAAIGDTDASGVRACATALVASLHASLTQSPSYMAGVAGVNASQIFSATSYPPSSDEQYQGYASIGDFLVAYVAKNLFGHPAATVAISNDLIIKTTVNATRPPVPADDFKTGGSVAGATSGFIALRLVQTLIYNEEPNLKKIVAQVLNQDPKRLSNEDNNSFDYRPLMFRAGDIVYMTVEFTGFTFVNTETGGVLANAVALGNKKVALKITLGADPVV